MSDALLVRRKHAPTVDRADLVAAYRRHVEGRADAQGLTEGALSIGTDALEELVEMKTTLFDEWWLRNHYRYLRGMTEMDRRRGRVLARSFIGAAALGQIVFVEEKSV
jgi:hypothetical protein